MADQGRLDELKRKFEESPKRYFAPLANEYRKAGEAELAIELCRTYLPEQPSHMSGYIVYGQALHDAGQAEESAAVFKQALTLDPENIIALRQLGDIARSSGDQAGALHWYGKVLELDPRNEEIAAYVAALVPPSARSSPTGPERQAPPTIRPEPEPDGSAVRLEDIVSEPDSEQGPLFSDARHDGSQDTPQDATNYAPSDGPSAHNVQSAWEEEFRETAGAALGGGAEADAAAPPASDARTVNSAAQWSTPLETSESLDDKAASAPVVEAALEGPWHGVADSTERSWDEDMSAGRGDSDLHAAAHADASANADENAGANPDAIEQSEPVSPFVTETMAELYMQQGLHGEAIAIYRQLVLRRNDSRLHERIAELEASIQPRANAETVGEFFRRIGTARAHERVQPAAERGSSLSDLFGGSARDVADEDAATRLSGAFESPRPGSPNS